MLMLSKESSLQSEPGYLIATTPRYAVQAADPKIEEQPRCKAHHLTKPFGCFVHDRRHVLRRCKRIFRNDKDYCTFFLYRVVTLVAKTPFLMLLVAR
jgi:hypothetical protein